MHKRVIAIIPARGGSKGVLRKNIRLLDGKPLIAYAIEAGFKSPSVERVIVSTDDPEIANIAREYGAEVPFLRPKEFAQDHVPDQPVFQHALTWLKKEENYLVDFVLNLRATTPLKTVEDIEAVVNKWIDTSCDCVRTVTKVRHHPYWMVKIEGDKAKPFVDGIDLNRYHQRQLLPASYFFNGVVDGMTREQVLNGRSLFGGDMRVVKVPAERAIDIDTECDLELCEFLIQKNNFMGISKKDS